MVRQEGTAVEVVGRFLGIMVVDSAGVTEDAMLAAGSTQGQSPPDDARDDHDSGV